MRTPQTRATSAKPSRCGAAGDALAWLRLLRHAGTLGACFGRTVCYPARHTKAAGSSACDLYALCPRAASPLPLPAAHHERQVQLPRQPAPVAGVPGPHFPHLCGQPLAGKLRCCRHVRPYFVDFGVRVVLPGQGGRGEGGSFVRRCPFGGHPTLTKPHFLPGFSACFTIDACLGH